MKQKAKPVSKIPTTGKNTNQKKKAENPQGPDLGGSLLKMNEFTLIILGALVVTALVFFLFFRSPDPEGKGAGPVAKNQNAGGENMDLNTRALENRIAELEVSLRARQSPPPKPVVVVASKKAPLKKKAVTSGKKANLFHTVKKGETLWSISQKYKTSVGTIRKLNNMTVKDKIYPGNNILVRQK